MINFGIGGWLDCATIDVIITKKMQCTFSYLTVMCQPGPNHLENYITIFIDSFVKPKGNGVSSSVLNLNIIMYGG